MINSSFNVFRAVSQDIELALQAIEELHQRAPVEKIAVA